MSDSTGVPANFDPWNPIWVVIDEAEHKKSGLSQAVMLAGGGHEIGMFLPIFTSEKLANDYIKEREGLGWLPHPFVILDHFILFLKILDESYVALDFSKTSGVFIRRQTLLDELT